MTGMAARLTRDGKPVTVGSVEIECSHADCSEVIECEVTVRVGRDQDGDMAIHGNTDVADLWLHEFTHEVGGSDDADRGGDAEPDEGAA